jgi:hypothetical protein
MAAGGHKEVYQEVMNVGGNCTLQPKMKKILHLHHADVDFCG